jgi:purine-cytosine permease-like protein
VFRTPPGTRTLADRRHNPPVGANVEWDVWRWNWRGLAAYGVGFVVMIPCFSTGLYTGPVARALGGADIAMLVGLPVAAIVYLSMCGSIDLEHEKRRAAADVGLEPADGPQAVRP